MLYKRVGDNKQYLAASVYQYYSTGSSMPNLLHTAAYKRRHQTDEWGKQVQQTIIIQKPPETKIILQSSS
jgi:hypothetical protein